MKAGGDETRRVAVLVSGGGTNLQALLDAKGRGELPHAELALVVSSSQEAYAIERAKKHGINYSVIEKTAADTFDEQLLKELQKNNIEYIVLAGFLVVLGERVLTAYKGRIINIHPSLLPSFGGKGCCGINVHKKALERGVKISGATVHLVDSTIDGGTILIQKAVEVHNDDTPASLQRRVMEEAEWLILKQALELLCAGEL